MLHKFLSENKLFMSQEIKKNIIEYLERLKLLFKKYFSKPEKKTTGFQIRLMKNFFKKLHLYRSLKKKT
jgi:hypothetical protein